MFKFVTLASALLFTTAAFAADTTNANKDAVPSALVKDCPKNYICVTPEQLQLLINQQIQQMKLNEINGNPELNNVMRQYQKVMEDRTPPKPSIKEDKSEPEHKPK
jgi:hypothetical protein